MNNTSIQAKIFSLYAQIEGMKAANKMRELNGQALAYGEESFSYLAEDLDKLSKPDERAEKEDLKKEYTKSAINAALQNSELVSRYAISDDIAQFIDNLVDELINRSEK